MTSNIVSIFTWLLYIKYAHAYMEFEVSRNAFDQELYENVLDPELCEEQLSYIVLNSSMLRARFMDAGIRTPKGILTGNLVDLGNFHQCLEIQEGSENLNIEGKYCLINLPLRQENFELPSLPEWPTEWPEWPEWPEGWPDFPWPELIPNTTRNTNFLRNIEQLHAKMAPFKNAAGTDTDIMRVAEDSQLSDMAFRLAVCVPKTCTTEQALSRLMFNTTAAGLEYRDEFCRLKNDKPFVPGDYVAMTIFGTILLFTFLSTCYDLRHTVLLGKDPKKANTLYQSFSLYTNTRRILNFNSPPGAIECFDGIRSLAILWVIVGHTYSSQLNGLFVNPVDIFSWMTSLSAVWIMAAPITVDTFFMLSGALLVYTTVGKLSRVSLIKNIHLYYLNRLLRMFPILAAGVLLQATLFNHLSDGPQWGTIFAHKVHKCRTMWWATLLHVQNYVTTLNQCIGPTWYLAVDIQLHMLSPLILFWVLGKKRSAWISLTAAMLISLVVSSVYIFINEFQSAPVIPARPLDREQYLRFYYMNTLTRCSPFFVGMIFGYLLSIYKGKKVRIPKTLVAFFWACATVISASIIYSAHPVLQLDWDNQFVDSFLNSFMRPGWALCLGWMVFACVHGYGGPINWFLSLRMWKLPARISFAMYIFHYPVMFAVNASEVATGFFDVKASFYRSFADITMSLIVGFFVTLIIDSPFSTLIKLALGGGPKRPRTEKAVEKEQVNVHKEAINSAYVPEIAKTKL